jgi:hypothetical protein
MKRLWIALAATALLVPAAMAQEKSADNSSTAPGAGASSVQGTGTPEASVYEQRLREYMDSKLAVRRVAQERAAQRRARVAARQWYGYSNLRPSASPDPYNGEYSPRWGGNNSLYPNLWSGYGPSYVVLWPYSGMMR